MIFKIFKKLTRKSGGLFSLPLPDMSKTTSREDIVNCYARVFSSDDGKKVLDHLQRTTFLRSYGPEIPDEMLRHTEGQRALVQQIIRLTDMGRSQ